MARVTKTVSHLSLKAIMQKIRTASDADKRMRWQIVYTAAADPRDGISISKQLGCSRRVVTSAVSEYNHQGKKSFQGNGRGSNRSNFYLSNEEEVKFLKPFISLARRGLITTVSDITTALEERMNKSIPKSTVCRILHRHGWRKITTRPFHPLRDIDKQNDFKKNSLIWYPIL